VLERRGGGGLAAEYEINSCSSAANMAGRWLIRSMSPLHLSTTWKHSLQKRNLSSDDVSQAQLRPAAL